MGNAKTEHEAELAHVRTQLTKSRDAAISPPRTPARLPAAPRQLDAAQQQATSDLWDAYLAQATVGEEYVRVLRAEGELAADAKVGGKRAKATAHVFRCIAVQKAALLGTQWPPVAPVPFNPANPGCEPAKPKTP